MLSLQILIAIYAFVPPLLRASKTGIGLYLGFSSTRASIVDNLFLDNGFIICITGKQVVNSPKTARFLKRNLHKLLHYPLFTMSGIGLTATNELLAPSNIPLALRHASLSIQQVL